MKIYIPQISWHDRQPILSVDIQNRLHSEKNSTKFYRLATGGNDNHVNIWKISSTFNDDSENQTTNNQKPIDSIECLAELTQHQRSVNVVRFSPNLDDNLLASGDDDSLIFIWKYFPDEENSLSSNDCQSNQCIDNLFESESISIEIWKTHKILRGHNQDVSDICWSRDGQFLVSGSVDNNVFVWDIQRGTKMHRVVKEHNSYVQGVTWDPLNKYIASLSADRQLIVFNSKNGKTLHKIYKINFDNNNDQQQQIGDNNNNENKSSSSSKLFYDQTMMSFFRRLTFSPGGELLFAPSGILEFGNDRFENCVHVFERKSLNRPSFYLSTGKFSVAVKCCPVVFELRQDEPTNVFNIPYRIVFAVATEDSVLFYDSQQAIPFGHVSNLHYLRLTDLSWSSDGRILILTSTDGFSSFVVFDEFEELGKPYQGKLMDFESELASDPSIKTPNKINPAVNNVSPNSKSSSMKTKSPNQHCKIKSPLNKPKCSTPITEFFRKSSPSLSAKVGNNNQSKNRSLLSQTSLSFESPKQQQQSTNNNNDNKPGRRVQLITLQTKPKPPISETLNSTVNVDDHPPSQIQLVTGTKRKQSEDSQNKQNNIDN
ncbi:chromatin assembly factor 1, p105 subunit [Dermatophagoides pteronyssinus]|uniref:chromatin assembly factor 1, p105 subunit n=1 Tax=Dermatophagoides pteronyssinus TaxID=6956 RepID=UPI003F66AE6E